MERSPCLSCERLHEDKRQPACVECKKRKHYDDSMGETYYTLPLEKTDMGRGRARRWTPEDDAFLTDNYLTMSNTKLGLELNRTVNSIICRLNQKNLKRSRKEKKTVTKTVGMTQESTAHSAADPSGQRVAALTGTRQAYTDFMRDQKKDVPVSDVEAWRDFFILDFKPHGDLYDRFLSFCSSQYREPRQQIFYMISQAVENHAANQTAK